MKGILRGILLTLLLGITCTYASLQALDKHLSGEDWTLVLVALLLHIAELHLHTVLLAPLQQFRLEVDFLISHLIDIDELGQDAVLHKTHTSIVATIEIDGSHKGFKGVATKVAVV